MKMTHALAALVFAAAGASAGEVRLTHTPTEMLDTPAWKALADRFELVIRDAVRHDATLLELGDEKPRDVELTARFGLALSLRGGTGGSTNVSVTDANLAKGQFAARVEDGRLVLLDLLDPADPVVRWEKTERNWSPVRDGFWSAWRKLDAQRQALAAAEKAAQSLKP